MYNHKPKYYSGNQINNNNDTFEDNYDGNNENYHDGNDNYDETWKVFRYLVRVHKWDAFVYLFLLLCNSVEINTLMRDIMEMKSNINQLYRRGGTCEEKYSKTIQIIDDYRESRVVNNEDKRAELIVSIRQQLELHNIPQDCSLDLVCLFDKMVDIQRNMLLNDFISRVYGFSKFTEHLNEERNKKDQTRVDECSQLNMDQKKNKEPSIIEMNVSKATMNEGEMVIQKLKQENEALRQEASKYQAELGGIRNVGWRDNDSNNSMQLVKDIEKLQWDLLNFTTVKRDHIQIKTDSANELFKAYQCETTINSPNMKLVLGAALQQYLIDLILKFTDEYFNKVFNDIRGSASQITDEMLDAAIYFRTNDLIELIKRFTETNAGIDVHTQLLPIKLRQHIYAMLGQRSFVKSNHPLIFDLLSETLSYMTRIIIFKEKNEKIQLEAASIIRKVLHIFYFRLYTQEPIPSIHFFKSGEVYDPGVMEIMGRVERDDEDVEELEVEICSFPAVVTLIEEEERRVFTKAQVIVRPKMII
ncbi:3590_t:CDS:1 [Funneliformis mosseae]|uniref:3590_t:CDS:1 n=1 Tax=Funneliformis mosseae TaxID=27381 RepID=A0A9N9BYH7_FUNMO|nr:3590_t:CDS:1 [Funneliformis mosseae]